MATTTYDFGPITPITLANNVTTAGQQGKPAIAANAAGQYFGAWITDPLSPDVHGRLFNSGGTPATDEFPVHPPAAFSQNEVSVAALLDGRFVVTYTDKFADPGGSIRGRFFNTDGSPGGSFDVGGVHADTRSDVTALADGGFAVSWTRLGVGNYDIVMSVYNADGSVRHASDHVNANMANTHFSSIAGLAGGGFVVAWEQQVGAGDTEVRFRRFDANGNALDGNVATGVLIDNTGTINRDIQIAGLPDGGFVVAYTDSGWGNGTDITARIFNADGTTRGPFLHVNSAANGGFPVGDQSSPTLAVLPNGIFVVGWGFGGAEFVQAYNAAGNALGKNTAIMFDGADSEIVALNGGQIASIWQSTVTDGSGDSIRSAKHELARLIQGDGSDETITGVGDFLWEVIDGKGGNDVLEGRGGRDTLRGGDGLDQASYSTAAASVTASLANPAVNTGDAAGDTYHSIEGLVGSAFDDTLAGDANANLLSGGQGNDTAVYAQSLDHYALEDYGNRVLVTGAEGTDQAFSIERFQFADGTITHVDDGNALFDQLYYLSHNVDVFHAGADAFGHFNASGRYEGRDPNAFFDTSGYLAANKDVAASGQNPLEHYHQTGWHEGRDPGADFDTTLYLIHNPDVAASGVDPLAHFLQFGRSEGRVAYQAIGSTIMNGFDAQYYLLHNPDVAAAGADALAHYNAFGRHEGRNPNAWFDTAGYLAHYSDVAASGANPLQHYMQFGWQEGRDPSAQFDTLGYLAANGDVAAAGVNPLAHFLQSGIYEGRAAVNDGLWHT